MSEEEDNGKLLESYRKLGRTFRNHHISFLYDINNEKLSNPNIYLSNYSKLNINKYMYKGEIVVFYVNNLSHLGRAIDQFDLIIFDPFKMQGIFADTIHVKQQFFSKKMKDIEFFVRFKFVGDSVELKGNMFNLNTGKYEKYEKEIKLFN